MALTRDPYRILGLPLDATLDEVKAAYRRLAKQSHPDSAGERALPRFLAIQAAYEALTEGPGALRLGARSAARGAAAARSRSSATDPERARATREAFRSRAGRTRARPAGEGSGAGPGGAAGSAGPAGSAGGQASAGRAPGSNSTDAGPRAGRSRARSKATPGSTSYDGVEDEPFEPSWEGASWYGVASGTYWTINPKEYADPRKHGPEYLERARRMRAARRPAVQTPPPDTAEE